MKQPFQLIFLCSLFAALLAQKSSAQTLHARLNVKKSAVEVFRNANKLPILTQNAKTDFRPYVHPILAPDGKGVLTQYSPGHHKHQTGLYWGCTRINGRDYFHHPEGDYWKRISVEILREKSDDKNDSVQWKTVYDLLDAKGNSILRETQTWTMSQKKEKYFLDLDWNGKAVVDVTIGKYNYGGLFLRMPWTQKTRGHATNSNQKKNQQAEGQRAAWTDVGMEIKGRSDFAHITIFDHPQNRNFPNAWRVDGQLGIGPAPSRLGDISIKKGNSLTYKHRLLVHTGELDHANIVKLWEQYSGQKMKSK